MSAGQQAEGAKKKFKIKRFTFRGHEEEEVYEMPEKALVELYRSRIRRRFKR
jgi:hypothetical protein